MPPTESPAQPDGVQPRIDLGTPLSLRQSFAFPLQSAAARREVLLGGILLFLLPFVGWLLNMGHRIQMVHQMQHGRPAWPAWHSWGQLLRNGVITWLGMVYYYAPSLLLAAWVWRGGPAWVGAIAALLFLAATVAIPGYMSHYCRAFDAREIFDPFRALRRVAQGGWAYWHAWGIALAALALSFLGLLAFGVGFLVTSVWFWQVAGFSFATVFAPQVRAKARGAR
jgi:hypothetical protein